MASSPLIGEVMSKLDEMTSLTMQAAGMPPLAVGKQGSMFAVGAASYVKGMFASAQAALASEVGLAEADQRYRIAAMQAAVERARIRAMKETAEKNASIEMQRLQMEQSLGERKLDLAEEELDLQKSALGTYQQALASANSIENLAYSLTARSYTSDSSSGSWGSLTLVDQKTGTTITDADLRG